MPKRMPVSVEIANVKARIRQSGDVEIGAGASGLTKNPSTAGAPMAAITTPAAPPASASSTLSTSSCSAIRARRRAECESYGDLTLPRRAAREEQVGDVGAG